VTARATQIAPVRIDTDESAARGLASSDLDIFGDRWIKLQLSRQPVPMGRQVEPFGLGASVGGQFRAALAFVALLAEDSNRELHGVTTQLPTWEFKLRPRPGRCNSGELRLLRMTASAARPLANSKRAICNAEFIGGGGLRTHIRTVPFCPSAQLQGGLSLPPQAGAVSLATREMRNRPRYVERKLLGRTGDSVDIDVPPTRHSKRRPQQVPPLGPFLLGAREIQVATRNYR
jgi:hypothetical protein